MENSSCSASVILINKKNYDKKKIIWIKFMIECKKKKKKIKKKNIFNWRSETSVNYWTKENKRNILYNTWTLIIKTLLISLLL